MQDARASFNSNTMAAYMTLTHGDASVKAQVFNNNKWSFMRIASRYTSRLSAMPGGKIDGGYSTLKK